MRDRTCTTLAPEDKLPAPAEPQSHASDSIMVQFYWLQMLVLILGTITIA